MEVLIVRKNWKHWGRPPEVVLPAASMNSIFAATRTQALARTNHSNYPIISFKTEEKKGGRA